MNALGMIETNSIPVGVNAGDAMLKAATVALVAAQPVCAGKYIVIVTGEVAIYRQKADKREILMVERRGAILGQFALISEGERLTAADARTDVQVIRLGRSMFLRVLEEFPDLAVDLHQRIIEDLEMMLSRMTTVMTRLVE